MFEDALEADWWFVFAVFAPLFLLWAAAFISLYRRKDLSIVRKLAWAAIIILTIYVGVALYFIMRPSPPPEGKRYDETVPRTSSIVAEIERLHGEHARGAIDDASYLAAKRDLLGVGSDGVSTP